ncbi:MAG: hypothetical protein KDA93_12465 [Planctomycetaceae bacterium]|nr:hypothetical protein [Planctomycetaceae bacterium]
MDNPQDSTGEKERVEAWMETFGVPPPRREDDCRAPPIDEQAQNGIRLLLQGQGTPNLARTIIANALRYRSWAVCLCDAIREVMQHSEEPATPQPPSVAKPEDR